MKRGATDLLGMIDRTFDWLIVVIFIVMVCSGVMQVFNRFVLNRSLSWSEELQRFSL